VSHAARTGGPRLRPFERGRGGIERGRRATQHRNRLAAQRREVDRIGCVRNELRGQSREHRRHIGTAVARHAVAQQHLASRFHLRASVHFQMQAQMRVLRLDPQEPRAIAHGNLQKLAIPREILGPTIARNAVDLLIRRLAEARLVPRPKAQPRQPPFWPDEYLGRAQLVHARAVQPHAGLRRVLCRINHADAADARAPQRKRKCAARLATAHDKDVVIDAGPVGHPIK